MSSDETRDMVCAELWRDICRTRLQYEACGSPVLLDILMAQIAHHNAIFAGAERPVH